MRPGRQLEPVNCGVRGNVNSRYSSRFLAPLCLTDDAPIFESLCLHSQSLGLPLSLPAFPLHAVPAAIGRSLRCAVASGNYLRVDLTRGKSERPFSGVGRSGEPSSTYRGGTRLVSVNLDISGPHLRRRGRNLKTIAQHILWPVNAEPPLTPTLIADRPCQNCK